MEKEDVKLWLRNIRKDRYWLAEKLLCKKRTVDAWLSSSAEIPQRAVLVISRLMSQYPNAEKTSVKPYPIEDNAITLTVDDATFDAWNQAATAEGKLLREWCVDVLNESLE